MSVRASGLPRWFRGVLVAVFLVLIGALLLLGHCGVRQAVASALLERMVRNDYLPMVERSMTLPRRRPEPPDGAYSVNGMLVEYHTMPAPVGPAETLRRFDQAFHQSGYVTRVITVMGKTTLAAIHPKTKMLLTVRPGRDASGKPVVRLSQQDLSQISSSFRAELPGLPVMSGARNRVLVRSVTGEKATSLTYTVTDNVDGAIAYYASELAARGWHRLMPPVDPPFGKFKALFFEKDGDECYLVAGQGENAAETIVMVTLTEKGAAR